MQPHGQKLQTCRETRRLTAPEDGRPLRGPRDTGLALAPVPFEHCVKIVQVATQAKQRVCCGAQHCLAVSAPAPAAGFPSGGLAFSWGWNGLGAAGQGSQLQVPSPKLVEALAGAVCVVQAAAGLSHTLLLSDLGDVYSCGWNGDGQLGLGDRRVRTEPTLVEHLTEPIQKVSCGGRHSLALGRCGRRLWAWGWGTWGQLGLGQDTEAKQLPQQVHMPGVSTCGASTQEPGLCVEANGPEGDKGPAGCSNGGELAAPEEKAGVILDVEGGRWHTLLLRT